MIFIEYWNITFVKRMKVVNNALIFGAHGDFYTHQFKVDNRYISLPINCNILASK